MISQVSVASVYVSDYEKAKAFYTEKLGFEVRDDQPMGPDSRWLSVVPPGAQTALVLVHGYADWTPERVGKSTGIVLGTDDIRATYEQLRDRGVHFTSEPEEQPW